MIPAKYWSPTKRLMLLGAMAGGKAVEDTATGNPLTFLTDLARPLKSLLIPFTPQQEGTGDPSPTNVRNIVPWDGLAVNHGGKNLLNTSVKAVYSVTTVGVGSVYGRYETKLKAGTYTFSVEFLNSEHYGAYLREKNGSETITLWTAQTTTTEKTFTITEDGEYNIWIYRSQTGGGVNPENIGDFQLEVGQTVTAYKPYVPITSTDISLPSPVYGGTLDAVTGVLTVDKAYQLLNDVDKWTQLTAGQTVDFSYEQDFERKLYDGSLTGLNCSAFLAVVNQNVAFCRWRGATSLKFGIKNGNSMSTPLTLEDVKQMATNGEIAICYDIEPQTVQLTGEQITALVGNNTIWSDADGSMTAVYLKKA